MLETTSEKCRIEPGNVYFISGHHLIRQRCEHEMTVLWAAFASESYYMHHRLLRIRGIPRWPLASMPWVEGVFQRFVEFFEEDPESARVRKDPAAGLGAKIEGTLMCLAGELIESTEAEFQWDDFSGLERIKPAIDFMDEHYLRNPSLAEIAQQLRLAPDYFHRLFKQETGLTPFKYMENRRLDLARKLLFDRRLNIKEVSQQTGYVNPFYFTRAFRRRFGLAPSRLRQTP